MYKIDNFAKITNTSIRTLRYYSDLKLEEFKLIKELQEVGFFIEEIKNSKTI